MSYKWRRRMSSNFLQEEPTYVAPTLTSNLRRTWEKLLLAARAIAVAESPAEDRAISSRMMASRLCWSLLQPPKTTPCAAFSGSSLAGVQVAFCKLQILVVTDPRVVWFNLLTLLWTEQFWRPCGCGRALRGQGHYSLHGSAIVDAYLGRSAPAWPHLSSAPAKVTALLLRRPWKDGTGGVSYSCKSWPRRNFRVSPTVSAPWFNGPWTKHHGYLLQPQASSAVFHWFTAEEEPAHLPGPHCSWLLQGHLKLFFHRFSNRKCK